MRTDTVESLPTLPKTERQLPPLTPDRAEACLRVWQDRLGLRDWSLRVFLRKGVVLGEGTLGRVIPHVVKRLADIELLEEADFEAQERWFYTWFDWEETLVHELLHLHFHDIVDPWPGEGTPIGKATERAIEALSRSLVSLSRVQNPCQSLDRV